MQKEIVTESELGKQLQGSPSEGGRLNRSFINYHFGIPELDEYLASHNKTLIDFNAEFGIVLYKSYVAFILYRYNQAFWKFSIKREAVIQINSLHGQNLSIRKDSPVSGGVLGAIGAMGLVGGIVAGTIDAVTSNKNNTSGEAVLGSIFEIVVQDEQANLEKVVISCTDKKKDIIGKFFSKISPID